MILNNVNDLFNAVLKKLKNERKKKKNFDGHGFWQPIKKILSNSSWKATKWKKTEKNHYEKIMKCPEYYIDGYGNKNIIEVNHFLIQTVRIPATESPSLKKIIQIGLNIGQYEGMTSEKLKYREIKCYLCKNDYEINLESILSPDNIEKLKKILL